MKFATHSLILIAAFFAVADFAAAQTKPKPGTTPAKAVSPIKGTAAYSEVLLHKTELTAELESLLVEYTEEFPRVKRLRSELGFLQKEIDRLLGLPAAEAPKLSVALGKMMVRKAQSEVDLQTLLADYKDDHPDVLAARKKVDAFEAAIKEILG